MGHITINNGKLFSGGFDHRILLLINIVLRLLTVEPDPSLPVNKTRVGPTEYLRTNRHPPDQPRRTPPTDQQLTPRSLVKVFQRIGGCPRTRAPSISSNILFLSSSLVSQNYGSEPPSCLSKDDVR